ncbi:MAG: HAMP domain-containing histidine kinase [Gemmataceae bacterium]|nr:HAMP domain-containing histidine kinase [Gemmataceae bacterium]MDW8265680.1 HAMP domain-containing sensor histidine kinase [Gemmataceae bacterium]
MKSIRLSLIVYLLLLLALALGAVSSFAYWTTAQTVEARRQTTHDWLLAQYAERDRRERFKLDSELLTQARALAGLAQTQTQWQKARFASLFSLGLLSAGLAPAGYVQVPLWLAEGARGALSYRLHRMLSTDVHLAEEELPHFADDPQTEYFQVNSEWGMLWKSPSLGDARLPLDARGFARLRLYDWRFDDVTVAGRPVRRIMLKVPLARFRVVWLPPPGGRPPMPSPPRPPGGSERYLEGGAPAIVIQCATDLAPLQAARDELLRKRDEELAQLEADARATLVALRDRLLLIGFACFAAAVGGGLLLVRVGLAPLRRLSDAVSQVSEKDFRLPFDGRSLPRELRPIVERLSQTLEQLRRAFAREKQAAADISHELRTPVAALLTTLEVALRKPRSAEEYREVLRDCQALGQQMSLLVERLLTLARLDAGVDTLRPQSVNVATLAAECAALVRPLAQARHLQLEVDCPKPIYLQTDPDKLREIITNLLHNAIEYNRPNGRVALVVAPQDRGVCLEVRDTGVGIAPEAQAHIFERFYRVDPSRENAGLHAGLGLAIVKGYVDLMGGRIAVESVEGEGSTFRVELPAA